MSVPDPIGVVHYDEPRAVKVRTPGNMKDVHSAVYGAVNIYAETQKETDALIAQWDQIMTAANIRATEILNAVRVQNQQPPVT